MINIYKLTIHLIIMLAYMENGQLFRHNEERRGTESGCLWIFQGEILVERYEGDRNIN